MQHTGNIHINPFTNLPAELQERIFTRLFDAAQIAKLSTEELREYETSVNAYRDIENAVETAKKVGESIGMKKGFLRINYYTRKP
jgi:hypothetical protein